MSAAREVPHPAAGDPVARARRAAPLIEAAAGRIEAAQALPPDLLDALHAARLFRTLLPQSFGGDEATPETYLRMMMVLAAADASTAWCIGQASGCSMAAAYVAPEVARTVWGPAEAVLAWGSVGPDQVADAVEGGWRVSGAWPFASGSRHASWLGGHCRVREGDGTPRRDADGAPVERTMLFPAGAATCDGDWRVMGLRGTGSDTYAVAGLFVPEAFGLRRDRAEERQPHGRGTLYRFTTTHLYASGFAGVALGIARRMLDDFVALAGAKTPRGSARRLCDSPVLQSGLAIAEAQWRAAAAQLAEALRETQAALEGGAAAPSLDQKAAIRLAATFAIHQAKAVADFAYAEAGAGAIFESAPFERRFRDIHAVTQQVQARRSHFETVGQHLMGLPPDPRYL
jgi:alkylation response protein AidB-like acyl-CoA dehydrogenase